VYRAVEDRSLLREVFRRLDRRDHSLYGQERGQVSCVGRDDDQGKEPPHATNDASRHGPRVDVRSLLHQRADGEPEGVGKGEDVLEDGTVWVARVRVVPLVRTEACQHVHHQTHHLQQQQQPR